MRALVGDDPRLEQLHRAVALTPILLALVAVSTVALVVAWCRGHRTRG